MCFSHYFQKAVEETQGPFSFKYCIQHMGGWGGGRAGSWRNERELELKARDWERARLRLLDLAS